MAGVDSRTPGHTPDLAVPGQIRSNGVSMAYRVTEIPGTRGNGTACAQSPKTTHQSVGAIAAWSDTGICVTAGAYPGDVATDPIDLEDDFDAALAKARRAAAAAGELRPPKPGGYVSPLSADEREAIRTVLADGTYARAAAAVGAGDPDLADQ